MISWVTSSSRRWPKLQQGIMNRSNSRKTVCLSFSLKLACLFAQFPSKKYNYKYKEKKNMVGFYLCFFREILCLKRVYMFCRSMGRRKKTSKEWWRFFCLFPMLWLLYRAFCKKIKGLSRSSIQSWVLSNNLFVISLAHLHVFLLFLFVISLEICIWVPKNFSSNPLTFFQPVLSHHFCSFQYID